MKKTYIFILLASLTLGMFLFLENRNTQEIPNISNKPKLIVQEITPGPKHKNFIEAPIKNASIKFKKESIKASSGKIIISKTGTRITVPPYAFLDENKKIVKGKVDLQYREFHNYADIFLSGIPMTYKNGQLESAGMIEITASLNNKPVYANPENKIKIGMASHNHDKNFNLYYMDSIDKAWKLKTENLLPLEEDKEEEEDKKIFVSFWGSKSKENTFFFTDQKVKLNGKETTLIFPKAITGNYYDFNLDLKKYPELSMYENIRWQTIDKNKVRDTSYSLMKKMNESIKTTAKIVNRIGESDSFKIRISGATSSVDIIFLPVFEYRDIDLAMLKYQEQMALAQKDSKSKENLLSNIKRQKSNLLVTRSFEIDGFGIYNCDRLFKLPVQKNIAATLIDADQKEINVNEVYVADRRANTVFTFNPKSIIYNPQSETILWTILEDGKVAIFSSESFKKLSSERNQLLTMKIIDKEINSAEDVKKILKAI